MHAAFADAIEEASTMDDKEKIAHLEAQLQESKKRCEALRELHANLLLYRSLLVERVIASKLKQPCSLSALCVQ
jgi:hypothetical protein